MSAGAGLATYQKLYSKVGRRQLKISFSEEWRQLEMIIIIVIMSNDNNEEPN